MTNWLGLGKKERLRPTGLVLTKGMSAINWLDLDGRVPRASHPRNQVIACKYQNLESVSN